MTARFRRRRPDRLLGVATVVLVTVVLAPGPAGQPALAAPDTGAATPAVRQAGPLAAAFTAAAARYDVPRDLLIALGYAETRLDGHGGAPSASGGYGIMHLTSNPSLRTLDEAARLTGLDRAVLRTDPAANVAGAAAVLRSYADDAGLTATARADLAAWYGPVVRYGGATDRSVARLYGDAVYDLLAAGFTATAGITVPGRPVAPQRGPLATVPPLGSPGAGTSADGAAPADGGTSRDGGTSGDVGTMSTDYGPAAWVPAHSGNYTVANRPTEYRINYVVVHVTQGSYAGSISWFQNPASRVSAHYTFRSSDGAVTQSVREKDVGWHAGNWSYNTQSIGIEHEGYVDNPSWFTDSMYRASAALTRNLTSKYGIPRDRSHIIAHSEVPGATHTDPGVNWNWTYYMQLVNGVTGTAPGTVRTSSGSLNVRSGPGSGHAVVGSLASGSAVTVYCQTNGTTVTGYYGTSSVWNRIGTARWVSDTYVNTGHSGFIPGVPRC